MLGALALAEALPDGVEFGAPAPLDPSENDSVALIIGVNRVSGLQTLQHAESDAEKVAVRLQSGGRFAKVELLNGEAATREAVLERVAALGPSVGKNGTFFLYFAGHGLAPPRPDGAPATENPLRYILLSDSHPDDLEASALLSEDLRDQARAAAVSGPVVQVYDTCGDVFTQPGYLARGMSERQAAGGLTVQYFASSPGEKAVEILDIGGGLYTFHWLAGLDGPADRDGDGVVDSEEAHEYAAMKLHEGLEVQQTPTYVSIGGAVHAPLVELDPRRFGPRAPSRRNRLLWGAGLGVSPGELQGACMAPVAAPGVALRLQRETRLGLRPGMGVQAQLGPSAWCRPDSSRTHDLVYLLRLTPGLGVELGRVQFAAQLSISDVLHTQWVAEREWFGIPDFNPAVGPGLRVALRVGGWDLALEPAMEHFWVLDADDDGAWLSGFGWSPSARLWMERRIW